MSGRRIILLLLAVILGGAIVGWHLTVPWREFGLIPWIILGPLLWMVGSRLIREFFPVRAPRWLVRYQAGLCTECGYDLRSSPDTCPECGHSRLHPDRPLPAPGAPDRPYWSAPELEKALRLMTLREVTPDRRWPNARQQAVAELIVRACRRTGGWTEGEFRPDDSFAMMIYDWEGMVMFDISVSLSRDLKLELRDGDYKRFLAMTFGQVVEELAGRERLQGSKTA